MVFHFFFYIVAPGTYFEISINIASNVKLKQLFITVVTFLILTVIIALIDTRYRIYNSRRRKILSKESEWGKYCQVRLHEEVRWPSFPIEFKLMVILNIWSFNALYVLEVPTFRSDHYNSILDRQ